MAGEAQRYVGLICPRGPIDGQSVASVFGVNADVSLRLRVTIGNAFSRVPVFLRRDYAITLSWDIYLMYRHDSRGIVPADREMVFYLVHAKQR